MNTDIKQHFTQKLDAIKDAGLYKEERIIASAQSATISLSDGREVLNLCANNYLGLAQHPEVNAAAKVGLEEYGYGMASVRFICGTQTIHKQLENQLSAFLETEDTILYPSCFDANGGLFETILDDQDAVISDALNHASIIDGVRLCKAKRYRYSNNDMQDLEKCLQQADADGARIKLITTDGVFSMDGYVANLKAICDLADKYGALVHVDDCHATGFVGEGGKGSHEYCGVLGRIDLLTGTLGKALGGASGGYTSGRTEIVELLRQRSRPYLFSNTVAPSVVAGALKAIDIAENSNELRKSLRENTRYYRDALTEQGFDILEGDHPIVPIMLYDAKVASSFAKKMLDKGVYVIAFSFPVVPEGKARIRTQISAGHSRADIDKAIAAFTEVKNEMGI
ncbi:glycine C-acetyltransferase [Cocleimonas sp. KMM 6892]|uniref:glycine C-acetyltransferase n=1 Tax=unclassified Cocleimonas TaxID=2639732 RepID=UPI002DBA333F|nr:MULTISPECIES: glycine C-acetyltransferase [unclassified Cocleimonas]MEB8431796.1 glycine C-acetyltransferase [Cocleimonas sp. KMM 6892]MEC4715118.1 glycine C-acetyltransferase [Cocleimonas sp. KMM 6895]MEC4744068.1 glycine C-acetyltransferase [Cocleimonas sp. KMM 6896]